VLLGTLAEHSYPFTAAPVIIELAKSLARDPKALHHLTMDRTTASYKMRFGLAETFKQNTVNNLKANFFSLNLDESTANNLLHVLSVLVSYFSPEKGQIIIEHLCSFSVIKVDAESLFNEVSGVIEKMGIPWSNLISILTDSCNVMRGHKSGLETRIRDNKAKHLLDIDGDSCHHLHNSAKEFSKPFEKWLENLFTDLFNDFKWSADLRDYLAEVCLLLGVAYTMPERYVSHRWLSSLDVAMDTSRLFEAYTMFYYAFIPSDSMTAAYTTAIVSIFREKEVSDEAQDRIREIRKVLAQKAMTEDGKNRKARIVKKLFTERKKTLLLLKFYVSALQLLKSFVCLFETKQPLIHKLHDQQEELFRRFLACFVKPEALLDKSARELQNLDLSNEDIHLNKKDMFVGGASSVIATNQSVEREFREQVSQAYVICGAYLQKKLPLNNVTLKCISAVDPQARGTEVALKRLLRLRKRVSILAPAEEEVYDKEVRSYNVDPDLPADDLDGNPVRIDVWWFAVSKRYPFLGKVVLGVLSCFHGPQVEGTFNVMGDVIDKRSSRMNIETYDSIQTVKYALLAKERNAVQHFQKEDYLHDHVDVNLCNNLRSAYSKYKAVQEEKREKTEKKKLKYKLKQGKSITKRKAKELQKLAAKKARKSHEAKMKRQSRAEKRSEIRPNSVAAVTKCRDSKVTNAHMIKPGVKRQSKLKKDSIGRAFIKA
jgi:hypothetical protein